MRNGERDERGGSLSKETRPDKKKCFARRPPPPPFSLSLPSLRNRFDTGAPPSCPASAASSRRPPLRRARRRAGRCRPWRGRPGRRHCKRGQGMREGGSGLKTFFGCLPLPTTAHSLCSHPPSTHTHPKVTLPAVRMPAGAWRLGSSELCDAMERREREGGSVRKSGRPLQSRARPALPALSHTPLSLTCRPWTRRRAPPPPSSCPTRRALG